MIAEQKIRIQRILGQLLKDQNISKNVGNRYLDGNETQPSKTLSHYGISKNESSIFQTIANIPDE